MPDKRKKQRLFSTAMRGSETWWMNVKRSFWAGVRWLTITAGAGLAFGLGYLIIREPKIFYFTWKYSVAAAKWVGGNLLSWSPVGGGRAVADQMRVIIADGPQMYSWVPHDLMEELGPYLLSLLWSSIPWAVGGSLLGAALYWPMSYLRGAASGADEVIRGGQIAESKKLIKLIKKRRQAGSLTICDVPIIKDTEFRHTLITGATGVGKTTLLTSLLAQMRQLGHRVVVYDIKGEFVSIFYRHGDYILNPLDARSVYWNPWADIYKQTHVAAIAAGLIPSEDPNSDNKFWVDAARLVVANAFRRLPTRDLDQYLQEVVRVDLDRLARILEGTNAAAILNKDIQRTALNVRATIGSRTEALNYLWKSRPEYKPFSLRQWVNSEDPGWLFLTTKDDEYEAMQPLYTIWFNILTEAIMSASGQRNIFLVMDELDSLGQLRSLRSLMARARSYGAGCIIGFQNIHQLRKTYGPDDSQGIVGNCNTWVCFAQPDPITAKLHSDSSGKVEIDEYQETIGYGGGRGDSLRMTPTRHERPLVTPDQIMQLPRGSAWLRLSEGYPFCKVQTTPVNYPKVAPAFVEVDWNRTIWGPWEGRETISIGPARINPGRPDLRLLA